MHLSFVTSHLRKQVAAFNPGSAPGHPQCGLIRPLAVRQLRQLPAGAQLPPGTLPGPRERTSLWPRWAAVIPLFTKQRTDIAARLHQISEEESGGHTQRIARLRARSTGSRGWRPKASVNMRGSREGRKKIILSGNYCAGVAVARAPLCVHKERWEQDGEEGGTGGRREGWRDGGKDGGMEGGRDTG